MARHESMVDVVRAPDFIDGIKEETKRQVRNTVLRVPHQRLGEVSIGLMKELGLEVEDVSYAGYPVDDYDYAKGSFDATPYYTVEPESARESKMGWRLAHYQGRAFRSRTGLIVVEKVPMEQTENPTVPRPDTGIVIPLHSHSSRSRWDQWPIDYPAKLQAVAAVEQDLVTFANAVHDDSTAA